MSHLIDITGQRFGRLVVLKKIPNPYNKNTRWLCQCDCGNLTEVAGCHLKGGKIVACGCFQKQRAGEEGRKRLTTHGLSGTPLHDVWVSMKDRCYLKSNGSYPDYGGRGIKVCKEWRNNFLKFREWALANGWEKGLTIERKRVNGNYTPSNCKWIPASEQGFNTRKTIRVKVGNKMVSLKVIYNEANSPTSFDGVRYRLSIGWPLEKTLNTPPATGKYANKYKNAIT